MSDHHGREFTGWFIPKHVIDLFEADIINAKEMILLARIDSLSKNRNGCYASNEYLGEQLQMSKGSISKAISKLKKLKLLHEAKFDGRKRYLKTYMDVFEDPDPPACSKPAMQRNQKQARSVIKNDHHSNRGENKRPSSKVNLRRRVAARSDAPCLVSHTEEDRTAAALLRSVLIQYRSHLTVPPRKVSFDTFVKYMAKLRIDRAVPSSQIMEVLRWLEVHYGDEWVPDMHKAEDFYTNFEKYRKAMHRAESNGSARAVSNAGKRTAAHRRKMELRRQVLDWAKAEGFIGHSSMIVDPSTVKLALTALGEDPKLITATFVNSGGDEE